MVMIAVRSVSAYGNSSLVIAGVQFRRPLQQVQQIPLSATLSRVTATLFDMCAFEKPRCRCTIAVIVAPITPCGAPDEACESLETQAPQDHQNLELKVVSSMKLSRTDDSVRFRTCIGTTSCSFLSLVFAVRVKFHVSATECWQRIYYRLFFGPALV